MAEIQAPFTPEQVAALNRFQQNENGHPFTCANGRDDKHLDGEGVLVATPEGWICPYCDYTQDWAHDFMAERPSYDAVRLSQQLRRQTICDDEELAVVQEQLTLIEHALAALRQRVTNPRNLAICSEAHVDQIAELKAEIDNYLAGKKGQAAGNQGTASQQPKV
jgi:hypothetical protein